MITENIVPLQLDDAGYRVLAQHRNGSQVELMLNYLPLPAPTVIPRSEAVYITVTDVDDLGQWLEERGGAIHVSAPFEGVELWTLHTTTEPLDDGSAVPIRVSVPVPAGESVMHSIRAAVSA